MFYSVDLMGRLLIAGATLLKIAAFDLDYCKTPDENVRGLWNKKLTVFGPSCGRGQAQGVGFKVGCP